jgi:hypothetical protein
LVTGIYDWLCGEKAFVKLGCESPQRPPTLCLACRCRRSFGDRRVTTSRFDTDWLIRGCASRVHSQHGSCGRACLYISRLPYAGHSAALNWPYQRHSSLQKAKREPAFCHQTRYGTAGQWLVGRFQSHLRPLRCTPQVAGRTENQVQSHGQRRSEQEIHGEEDQKPQMGCEEERGYRTTACSGAYSPSSPSV